MGVHSVLDVAVGLVLGTGIRFMSLALDPYVEHIFAAGGVLVRRAGACSHPLRSPLTD
jgi:hypothetical protein